MWHIVGVRRDGSRLILQSHEKAQKAQEKLDLFRKHLEGYKDFALSNDVTGAGMGIGYVQENSQTAILLDVLRQCGPMKLGHLIQALRQRDDRFGSGDDTRQIRTLLTKTKHRRKIKLVDGYWSAK